MARERPESRTKNLPAFQDISGRRGSSHYPAKFKNLGTTPGVPGTEKIPEVGYRVPKKFSKLEI